MASFAGVPYGPGRKPWREGLSQLISSLDDGIVSAPSSDPLQPEISPAGVTPVLYQVPSTGLSREDHDRAMRETLKVIQNCRESFLGFQCNHSFSVPELFQSPFTNVLINNGGDAFSGGAGLSFRPKWMERGVLDYYASLWNAKWPHDPNDPESYWGYVLSMGSSEGNIHALWSARNYLSGRYEEIVNTHEIHRKSPPIVKSKAPVVFFSRNSNASLSKLCNLVNISTFDAVGRELYPEECPLGGEWLPGVPCEGGNEGPGTVDITALEKLVDFFSIRGHPIVVIFNYGTSFKGVCDDIEGAGMKLVKILKKNGMYERVHVSCDDCSERKIRKGFWFHVDGALAAAYMPFLEIAYKNGLTDVKPASTFDFRLGFVSSIVMSGHKYIGIPWPCGVYLVRNSKQVLRWPCHVDGLPDTTVALSRNAHSAVLLWSFISSNSYDTQVSTVLKCLKVAKYTVEQFKKLEIKLNIDLCVMNISSSLSVIFRRPNARIVEKYTLFCPTLSIDSELRRLSQIYIMSHVTTEMIDALVKDLSSPDAFKQ